MKALIESAFDTGLVDEAVSRVTHSFKRRRTSVDDDDSNNNKLDPVTLSNFMSAGIVLEQEKGGQPGVRLNPPPDISVEQRTHSSGFAVDFQVTSSDSLQADPWGSGLSASLGASTAGSFEFISPSELDNRAVTQSREQLEDSWLNFGPEPIP